MSVSKCSLCHAQAQFKHADQHYCEPCAQKMLEKVMAVGLEFVEDHNQIKDILHKTLEKVS